MTSVMERLDDYWSGGDPVTRNRFLLKTITPMVTIVSSYVLFVRLIGPYIMKNRKPIQMRPLIIVYNFGIVAFYLYFLSRGSLFIPELGFSFICGSLNLSENPIIPSVFDLGYQLYVVRYIELLDTVFLVLSKKFDMVTSLHVFHHSIVPVFGWFGFRSESSGYLGIFMGLNCIVHIIMYTYYAIAALGPKYQKYIWWKKYLTSLQILQFLIMSIYVSVMYMLGCTTSNFTFAFCNFLSIIFFFLFIDYYNRAYNSKENKESTKANGLNKLNGNHEESGIHKLNLIKQNGIPAVYKSAPKKKE